MTAAELRRRERLLRREAEASAEPAMRATLLRLAAVYAASGSTPEAAHPPLATASRYMTAALRILDVNGCTASATKLAEAIAGLEPMTVPPEAAR